jgi:2-dehydro-3-deoxyphosphogluconate aldolase/(4S)-4-hydroxy-2-oxoglutarate aldolase
MHAMFRDVKVIPVLTIEDAADAVPLARALAKGGLRVLEITLRTPASLAAVTAIARDVPEVTVGAGTVLRPADVTRAKDAGAKFLVSPGLTPDLAAAGLGTGMPYLPGAVTPSEIMVARDLGCSFLKFFPAEPAGGVAALRSFAAVFAGVAFCPTGGVTAGNLADYLALPNVPLVGGSWMVPADAIAARAWDRIEAVARDGVALAGTIK